VRLEAEVQTLGISAEEARDAKRIWWLFALVGVASTIAGIILVLEPSNSLATLAVVVGIFLLIDGIAELFRSFGHEVENRALAAILGVLGIVIGIILIRHPFHGVTAIGLLIGIWLVAAGVIRLVRSLVLGLRFFQLLIAAVEIIAGIVVVSDPHIGYATLAILVGIWLILNGLATIFVGFTVRRIASESIPTGQVAG
jgi:uncharacterized membrane protein HdeD (DUF308 family)